MGRSVADRGRASVVGLGRRVAMQGGFPELGLSSLELISERDGGPSRVVVVSPREVVALEVIKDCKFERTDIAGDALRPGDTALVSTHGTGDKRNGIEGRASGKQGMRLGRTAVSG